MRRFRIAVWLGAALWAGALLPAQDPRDEIRRIVEQVNEELREIDRLLQETAKRPADGAGAGGSPVKRLEESATRSGKVVEGIDELLKKLEEMRQQNQQQGGEGDPQERQQDEQQQQQQQRNRQRQENQRPDVIQQDRQQQQGQQPGEQQQPQDQQGQQQQPSGPDQHQGQGQNRPGQDPTQDPSAPGQRGDGRQNWGDLPPYVNELKQRGSPPKVPEKFRQFWEAYLKGGKDK